MKITHMASENDRYCEHWMNARERSGHAHVFHAARHLHRKLLLASVEAAHRQVELGLHTDVQAREVVQILCGVLPTLAQAVPGGLPPMDAPDPMPPPWPRRRAEAYGTFVAYMEAAVALSLGRIASRPANAPAHAPQPPGFALAHAARALHRVLDSANASAAARTSRGKARG